MKVVYNYSVMYRYLAITEIGLNEKYTSSNCKNDGKIESTENFQWINVV